MKDFYSKEDTNYEQTSKSYDNINMYLLWLLHIVDCAYEGLWNAVLSLWIQYVRISFIESSDSCYDDSGTSGQSIEKSLGICAVLCGIICDVVYLPDDYGSSFLGCKLQAYCMVSKSMR